MQAHSHRRNLAQRGSRIRRMNEQPAVGSTNFSVLWHISRSCVSPKSSVLPGIRPRGENQSARPCRNADHADRSVPDFAVQISSGRGDPKLRTPWRRTPSGHVRIVRFVGVRVLASWRKVNVCAVSADGECPTADGSHPNAQTTSDRSRRSRSLRDVRAERGGTKKVIIWESRTPSSLRLHWPDTGLPFRRIERVRSHGRDQDARIAA